MAQTNLTIRIDENLKREAETLFTEIGLTMSAAINVFFRQAIRERAIPFQLKAKAEDEKKYNEYFNEYNMRELAESIAQIERGEVITFTMDELLAMEEEDAVMPQRAVDFIHRHKEAK
ncbi:MAG: type II toxin-antitoxin system RelB/DinJ family antitoxin [Clostridiales bacterium]|nr:type II toxin-antitoxin system RelB/DinJ family antitoxin [Clostridiales bacterium]